MAFVMTPRAEQPDPTEEEPNPPAPDASSQQYPTQMGLLATTLTTLIPGVTIMYYNYIAVNVEQYTEDYQGSALFEYDSDADGLGHPNWRLWYEQNSETGLGLGMTVN